MNREELNGKISEWANAESGHATFSIIGDVEPQCDTRKISACIIGDEPVLTGMLVEIFRNYPRMIHVAKSAIRALPES